MKKSILLAAAVAAALTSSVASAELSANAAIASNYIWRGVTQTADQAAAMGGLDWGHDSGIYAGTWVSNVNYGAFDGYEMDLYVGFGGEAGDIGYDLGVISYQYPVTPGSNFTEVYASATFEFLTAGVAYTVDKASAITSTAGDDDLYIHASADFPVGKSDMSVYVGDYSFDANSAGDYTHFGASISKDGFTFAADKNDIKGGTADNVRFTVSYAVDFEL